MLSDMAWIALQIFGMLSALLGCPSLPIVVGAYLPHIWRAFRTFVGRYPRLGARLDRAVAFLRYVWSRESLMPARGRWKRHFQFLGAAAIASYSWMVWHFLGFRLIPLFNGLPIRPYGFGSILLIDTSLISAILSGFFGVIAGAIILYEPGTIDKNLIFVRTTATRASSVLGAVFLAALWGAYVVDGLAFSVEGKSMQAATDLRMDVDCTTHLERVTLYSAFSGDQFSIIPLDSKLRDLYLRFLDLQSPDQKTVLQGIRATLIGEAKAASTNRRWSPCFKRRIAYR